MPSSRRASAGAEWERLRTAVLERDMFQCQLQFGGCLGTATEADHVAPRNRGGQDLMENLVAACKKCNGRKQDRMLVRKTYFNARYLPGYLGASRA